MDKYSSWIGLLLEIHAVNRSPYQVRNKMFRFACENSASSTRRNRQSKN